MAAPLLSLDSTALLFVPPQDDAQGYVVQVTLRAPSVPFVKYLSFRSDATVETIAGFDLVQHEVSALGGKVIANHLHAAPLPPTITIQGAYYTISISRKSWTFGNFGRRWTFRWGDPDDVPSAL